MFWAFDYQKWNKRVIMPCWSSLDIITQRDRFFLPTLVFATSKKKCCQSHSPRFPVSSERCLFSTSAQYSAKSIFGQYQVKWTNHTYCSIWKHIWDCSKTTIINPGGISYRIIAIMNKYSVTDYCTLKHFLMCGLLCFLDM